MLLVPGAQLGVMTENDHTGGAIAAPQNASTMPDHDTVSVSPGANALGGSIVIRRLSLANVTCAGAVARSKLALVPRSPVIVMTPTVGFTGCWRSSDNTGDVVAIVDASAGDRLLAALVKLAHATSSSSSAIGLSSAAVPLVVSRT